MNQHQTERVRSYLRGRLQLAILQVYGGVGGFIVAPLGQATGSGDYYPTLEELAARHGVTIPESIMHGPLDNQPEPATVATATTIERTEPMRVHKSVVIQFLRTHPDEREQVIPGWMGTVEEYIAELERRPGQFFVNGELIEEATKAYEVYPARYSKGKFLVRCPSSDGYKTRAARLVGDGLNGRWTHREQGYVVSPSKLTKFERLYNEGWDASTVTGKLYLPTLP